MIQRGYIILIAGGALFAMGIAVSAVWGIELANIFLQDNTLVNAVSIAPGQSIDATRQVTDISRPLSVAIHIQGVDDAGSETTLRDDIRIVQTVQDPSGTIVSRNEFSGNLFTTFTPERTGNYVLTMTNAGTETVTVDGTFGYMPFIVGMNDGSQQQHVDFGRLTGVVAGAILVVTGFFTIIAGIIVLIADRKKKGNSAATSEGGITYRKE